MTGFDVVVLAVVGAGAVLGLLRGFVHEVLSLLAWVVALAAIHHFHTALSAFLVFYVRNASGAAVLAFLLLALVPYVIVRMLARALGRASRGSVLGSVDRLLGLGFGAVKGMLIVVLVFSVLVLGYDTLWGKHGRPAWITGARSYAFINACSEALVTRIGDRHRAAVSGDGADTGTSDAVSTGDIPDTSAVPPKHKHHRHADD